MADNKYEGLYFPYADFRSLRTLKTAVLFFDKIAIIDPNIDFCGKSNGLQNLDGEMLRFMKETQVLVEENVVELINPTDTISKFGKEVMDGVIQDLYDDDFLKSCQPFGHSAWVLSCAKVPDTDVDKWLRNMLVNVPKLARGDIMYNNWRHSYQYFAETRRDFHERTVKETGPFEERKRYHYYEEKRRDRYSDEDRSYQLREMSFDEYRTVVLPFAIGESIMIGHTLAVAADKEFIPFCDERIHYDLLKAKIRRYSDNRSLKDILYDYGYLKDVKTSMLARDIIAGKVPSLEHVSIETILRFKEEKADELDNFRVEMRRLATEIKSNPWDDDFGDHVIDIVDSRVNPALKEIEKELRECKDSFWVEAVNTFPRAIPIPVIGCIFAGIPEHIALGLGTSIAGLELILKQWLKRRKISRNGFALLLEANNRFR